MYCPIFEVYVLSWILCTYISFPPAALCLHFAQRSPVVFESVIFLKYIVSHFTSIYIVLNFIFSWIVCTCTCCPPAALCLHFAQISPVVFECELYFTIHRFQVLNIYDVKQ